MLAKDQAALTRFCDKAETLGEPVSLMFVPYGEALIHDYYIEALSRLCSFGHVLQVSAQTNLSFSAREFLRRASECGNKLRLWCSFHPSQTDIRSFAEKCGQLAANGISLCAGAVGDPRALDVLKELRQELPHDVYLWINAMEGRNHVYSAEEKGAFLEIDPLFHLETSPHPADAQRCVGGRDAFFVEGNGDFFACNISGIRLGNLFAGEGERDSRILGASPRMTGEHSMPGSGNIGFAAADRSDRAGRIPEKICRAKDCHCFLAYVNRVDLAALDIFGEGRCFRLPDRKRAVFFDVDGTLTDATGHIPEIHVRTLAGLAATHRLFLATALPYAHARRKCRAVWEFIEGGVFAEGSDLRLFEEDFHQTIPLEEGLLPKLPSGIRYHACRENGRLHKITARLASEKDVSGFRRGIAESCAATADRRPGWAFRWILEDRTLGIVAAEATKPAGIRSLCARLNMPVSAVIAVGNSDNDAEMLSCFPNSVAAAGASPAARNAANTVLNHDLSELLHLLCGTPG